MSLLRGESGRSPLPVSGECTGLPATGLALPGQVGSVRPRSTRNCGWSLADQTSFAVGPPPVKEPLPRTIHRGGKAKENLLKVSHLYRIQTATLRCRGRCSANLLTRDSAKNPGLMLERVQCLWMCRSPDRGLCAELRGAVCGKFVLPFLRVSRGISGHAG